MLRLASFLLILLVAAAGCDSAPSPDPIRPPQIDPPQIDPPQIDPPVANAIRVVGPADDVRTYPEDDRAPLVSSQFESDYGTPTYETTSSAPDVVAVENPTAERPRLLVRGEGTATLRVTATVASDVGGPVSASTAYEVLVQPHCPAAGSEDRDLFPADYVLADTYTYSGYTSGPAGPEGGTSVRTYEGAATGVVTDTCLRGVRSVAVDGTATADSAVDGGTTQTVTQPFSLRFEITETTVSLAYADPFMSAPDVGVYALGPGERIAPATGETAIGRVMPGCFGQVSRARFEAGSGPLDVFTDCQQRLSGAGRYFQQLSTLTPQ